MMFGMLSLAICSILFGIANSYWQLVVARIAQGAAGGASWYAHSLRLDFR